MKDQDMGARLHPLHDARFVSSVVAQTGRYPGARKTGRTTALALEYLARAIREPYTDVFVRDHHDKPESHRELLRRIGRFADDLKLDHVCINHVSGTIRFGSE